MENLRKLRRRLRIDRMWWTAVKVGAIVAVSVLVAIALAFLYHPAPGRAARRIIRDEELFYGSIHRTTLHPRGILREALGHNAGC